MNLAIGSALIALFALSIPIAVAIALTAVIGLYFFSSVPLLVVPQRMFVGLDSFPLMAVPFFILAGHIIANPSLAVVASCASTWVASCARIRAFTAPLPRRPRQRRRRQWRQWHQ